jgi:hypothetical protein
MPGSFGKAAWIKYYKGKGDVKTVMKEDSPLRDIAGKVIGKIKKGEEVIVMKTKDYFSQMPIKYKRKEYFTTFSNIQKPGRNGAAAVRVKPQHFKFPKDRDITVKELANSLINEIEDRTDFEGDMRNFLIDITQHYGGIKKTTHNKLKLPADGMGLVNSDYGEMLGAMACVNYGILQKHGVSIRKTAKMNFPIRGNEPIVDYYLIDGRKKYSISAKSGTTTNTLKTQHIRDILKSRKEWPKWQRKKVANIIDIISDNPTAKFPWLAINVVEGKKILSDEAIEVATSWKSADFRSKDYVEQPFAKLKELVSSSKDKLKIGQLYYQTEAYVVSKMNSLRAYDPTDIFVAAVQSNVIYVNMVMTNSNRLGKFHIMMPEANKQETIKQVKWRTKNTSNRSSDRVGVQP